VGFRNLSLNHKVAVTLVAIFASIATVFVLVLSFFHSSQRERVLDLKRDLLSTLRENYGREFVYHILSQDEQTLALRLSSLARHEGVVAAWVEAPDLELVATTEPRVLRSLQPSSSEDAGTGWRGDVLVVHGDQPPMVYEPGGRGTAFEGLPPLSIPPHFPEREGQGPFVLVGYEGSTVLSYEEELRAADQSFGRLHILYSLADLERTERITGILFWGLLGTTFVLLLLLLNLLLSRIVLAPVKNVLSAMRRAAKGELDLTLEVSSGDEMGTMADSFNHMVRDLKASKDEVERYSRDLEKRVLERTRALRESEERLLQLKNYLATVIANVETGVVSLDHAGIVTTFNEKAGSILAIDASQAEGKKLEELLTGSERGRILEALSPLLAGDRNEVRAQLSLRLPRGRRTVAVVASALYSGKRPEDERLRIGAVVVFDDVTKLIASQRLEAWKQATEKVIHEIKNPLTPIILAAQRLRSAHADGSENFDEIFQWGSKTILDSVTSLKDLITEFSRFYRMPRVVLRPQRLNDLVEEVLSLYAAPRESGVVIEKRLAEGLPEVEVDGDQLKRVLLNLLKNGVESLPEGKGTISVSTEKLEERGMLGISLRDDGTGIEDVEKIFEPYYTTKVKGTGLGLIISRQIIEEHGGEIEVRSEVGKGTEVRILLPPRRTRREREEEHEVKT